MNTERRCLIAVVGDAGAPLNSRPWQLAEQLGELIIGAGHRIVTGGLGGVMEAACMGARCSPAYTCGDTVGVLPGHDAAEASAAVDIVIPTGLDVARNSVVAHASAVIAIGGGAGTLSELAVAWMLKRLVIAFRLDGWSGRLADARIDGRVRYPDIPEDRVYGVDMPEEAVQLLAQWLPIYTGAYRGVRRRHAAC